MADHAGDDLEDVGYGRANDYVGDVAITQTDGSLALKIGPVSQVFPLRHWNGNVFVYTPGGENAPDGSVSTTTFTMDAAPRASGLAIEYFAASGRGDLVHRPV